MKFKKGIKKVYYFFRCKYIKLNNYIWGFINRREIRSGVLYSSHFLKYGKYQCILNDHIVLKYVSKVCVDKDWVEIIRTEKNILDQDIALFSKRRGLKREKLYGNIKLQLIR